MGGLMGDAVAQPVFQAGQMLIILLFLFIQSPWFGLAGVALIPLQAWLIPLLQRQINLLRRPVQKHDCAALRPNCRHDPIGPGLPAQSP